MDGLILYKKFIDGLVSRRSSSTSMHIKNGSPVPEGSHNAQDINFLIEHLSTEDRSIIAQLIQESKMEGIHAALAYINEQMVINNLRIVQNGITLPVEPFDTELFWDWLARCEGAKWPDEKGT